MLSLIPKSWLIGGIAVAVLGGLLWLQTERLDIAREARTAAEQQRAQWKQNAEDAAATAAGNAQALDAYVAKVKAGEAEAAKLRNENAALAKSFADALEANRNAPETENGPIRPVLCRALGGVRGIAGAAGPACD